MAGDAVVMMVEAHQLADHRHGPTHEFLLCRSPWIGFVQEIDKGGNQVPTLKPDHGFSRVLGEFRPRVGQSLK